MTNAEEVMILFIIVFLPIVVFIVISRCEDD